MKAAVMRANKTPLELEEDSPHPSTARERVSTAETMSCFKTIDLRAKDDRRPAAVQGRGHSKRQRIDDRLGS